MEQTYEEKILNTNNDSVTWVVLKDEDHAWSCEDSISEEEIDDASSSSLHSSPTNSYEPLYELSELMAQLPIKRGISKHYIGKSESFGSLSSVKSLEDLAKKGYTCKYRYKCNRKKSIFSPKSAISKKMTTNSRLTCTLLTTCRSPL